jgi:7-cyano-7-deazaguanine reductase
MSDSLLNSPLNKRSSYVDTYDKSLLFAIARTAKRDEIGVKNPLPFYGYDIWTAYELSWLDSQGKPVVAIGDILIPCESANIIESKSLKLYCNSLNNTVFDSKNTVERLLTFDLSAAVEAPVDVKLYGVEQGQTTPPRRFPGFCLDDLNVACSEYTVNADLLSIHDERVDHTTVYSHLLKSNCLVTGQPDWGSIFISYSGRRIDEASLLQYLVSFRNHNEFHEQCVERIFMDLSTRCCPETLTVYARYTRRGGLDINPIRSSSPMSDKPQNQPLFRQ